MGNKESGHIFVLVQWLASHTLNELDMRTYLQIMFVLMMNKPYLENSLLPRRELSAQLCYYQSRGYTYRIYFGFEEGGDATAHED